MLSHLLLITGEITEMKGLKLSGSKTGKSSFLHLDRGVQITSQKVDEGKVGVIDAVGEVVVVPLNFQIVDTTVRAQPAKSSITSWFVNLNTVHPSERKSSSFFASCCWRSSAQ